MGTRGLLPFVATANLLMLAAVSHAAPAIKVISPAIGVDGRISPRNSAFGENLSPAVSWTPAPGAKAYAVILQDPDAGDPPPFIHWLIWNIPAATRALPEHVSTAPHPPSPAGAAQGRNGFGSIGYGGPKPPSGVHHSHLIVFALNAPLALAAGADSRALSQALRGHVLASGEIVGTFAAPKP